MSNSTTIKSARKKPPLIVRSKTGTVVCHIDRQTGQGTYTLDPKCPQFNYAPQIALSQLSAFPAGLKRNGKGFTSNGYLVLKHLSEGLGKFELTIDGATGSSVRVNKRGARVVLNHEEVRQVQRQLAEISSEKYEQQNGVVAAYLGSKFPKHFTVEDVEAASYKAGTLARLLDRPDLVRNLSNKDVEKLNAFFPKFLKQHGTKLAAPAKLLALSKNKKAVEVVYLKNVVKEFERRLRAKNHNENTWQEFLGKYILVFDSNYASVLEKESIALHGKYPDFLLIDAFSYLDIYEIKKPNTNLLKKDESRDNYYWDVDLAKAIAQVENYIAYAERNAASLREDIKKRKGIEVRVMKPRGVIIAGQKSQLTSEAMADNFRLLNNGLKNIEVVLYDEILDNMKNFLRRLGAAH